MKKLVAFFVILMLCLPASASARSDSIKLGVFQPMTGSYACGDEMEMDGLTLPNDLFPEVL